MKKGISLIVLVITIIVLAILAAVIIINISNTNVMEEARKAKEAADLANANDVLILTYASAVAKAKDGIAYSSYTPADPTTGTAATGTIMTAEDYQAVLTAAGYSVGEGVGQYTVAVDAKGVPTLTLHTEAAAE